MKKKKLKSTRDLPDTAQDEERLQGDQGTLDLPDATDIPGQENVVPPRFNEFADTTASSADEEDILSGHEPGDEESNVSAEELKILDKSYLHDPMEGLELDELALDDKDEEGELLNEGNLEKDLFGEDLDSPLIDEEDSEGKEG